MRLGQFSEQKRLKNNIARCISAHDALLANLSSAALPPAVVESIGQETQGIKDEIEALRRVEPPKDYTTDTIKAWLESIKNAPDDRVIQLLIERIDVKQKPTSTSYRR